jgi:hypothetical protein
VSETLVRAPSPAPPQRPRSRTTPAGTRAVVLRRALTVALFVAFAAQMALAVARHEPWFDEAQAWLIARDSGLWELFAERLRYEGSPGLWHLVLMPFAKLGLPYAAIGWIGAGCALVGAALLLRRGPFPLWVKAGLLFSWAIGYQYAAVARSYTLMPLLLFAIADVWPCTAS